MKHILKYTLATTIIASSISCDVDNSLPEIKKETIPVQAGSADFSKYIALGASFTAGYTDGTVFKAGQENSFPNTLAKKFAMAGGGEFNQALTNDNIGGFIDPSGNQISNTRLVFDGNSPVFLEAKPTTIAGVPAEGSNFGNYGISGAKSYHFVAPGYGNVTGLLTNPITANPYYVRMSPTQANLLTEAVTKQPTFFTLSEVGGNDVLGFATSGGYNSRTETNAIYQETNIDPTSYGQNDITSPALFESIFKGMLDNLTANGAKGVVANLPYVTSLPYFTTIPHAPLDPTNPDFGPQIPTLNTVFGAINGVFTAIGVPERAIVFNQAAASAVVIKDESLVDKSAQITAALINSQTFPAFLQQFNLPTDAVTKAKVAGLLGSFYGQARQATAKDHILLPALAVIGKADTKTVEGLVQQGIPLEVASLFAVQGVSLPLEDKLTLTEAEAALVTQVTDLYNTSIKTLTEEKKLAFVNLNAILEDASKNGVVFDNYDLTTNLVTGGLVSLDGVHLTARGYALMANKILEAIDTTYGSNFTQATNGLAKAGDYPTNYSPSLR